MNFGARLLEYTLTDMDELAAHTARVMLMSAGGGLAVRRTLEAIGLRAPPEPEGGLLPGAPECFAALPQLSSEELDEYYAAGREDVRMALPAPEPTGIAALVPASFRFSVEQAQNDPLTMLDSPYGHAIVVGAGTIGALILALVAQRCTRSRAYYRLRLLSTRGNAEELSRHFRSRRSARLAAKRALQDAMGRSDVDSAFVVLTP